MMIYRKKDDDDNQVNKYSDQRTSEEETEEKYNTKRSKEDALESDISEPDERDQRKKKGIFKWMKTPTKEEIDNLVDTDNV